MLGFFFMRDILNPPRDWSLDVEPVDYTPKFKFSSRMFFRGETYNKFSLFDVEPCANVRDHNGAIFSPNGCFLYREVVLPARGKLECSSGKRRGEVCFDSDVLIPQVHEVPENLKGKTKLWMSHTPNEVMTLRPGTRFAKGHVVIGGLGLGYQLLQVAAKRSVKRITVVERSQELVDWILPRVLEKMPKEIPVDVIIGSVFEELPKLTADVALIDIWEDMTGCQGYHKQSAWRLRNDALGIGKVWCWGETS